MSYWSRSTHDETVALVEIIGRHVRESADTAIAALPQWKRGACPPAPEVLRSAESAAVIARTPRTFEAQARVFAALVTRGHMPLDEIPTRHLRAEVARLLGKPTDSRTR